MPEEKDKCLGCEAELRTPKVLNSLSRYGHGHICTECGAKEAFEGDFISKEADNYYSNVYPEQ
jgi:hypothetical protein